MNNRHPDLWAIKYAPVNSAPVFTYYVSESAARKAYDGLCSNGYGQHRKLIAPTAGAGILL
jgi:hypothetical protein